MATAKLTELQLNSKIQDAIADIQEVLKDINALDHLGKFYSLQSMASRITGVLDTCDYELFALEQTMPQEERR